MHRQPSHLLALEHACLRPRRVIVVNIKIKFKRSICTHTHSRVTYIYSRLVRKAQFMSVHRTSCVCLFVCLLGNLIFKLRCSC